MATIATKEPLEFYAGDTVEWKKTLGDYPASSGWILKYDMVCKNVSLITFSATADGDDYLVSLPAATTQGYPEGEYFWRSYVVKGELKYGVSSGYLIVKANLSEQLSGYDFRSTAKKVVDALESALAGDTSATTLLVISQSCGDLNVSRKADVYDELQKWKSIVKAEREKYEVENGRGKRKSLILTRFINT